MTKLKEEKRIEIEKEIAKYNTWMKRITEMYRKEFGNEEFKDTKEYQNDVCLNVKTLGSKVLKIVNNTAYFYTVKMEWGSENLKCIIQVEDFIAEINFNPKNDYEVLNFKTLDKEDSSEKLNNVRE